MQSEKCIFTSSLRMFDDTLKVEMNYFSGRVLAILGKLYILFCAWCQNVISFFECLYSRGPVVHDLSEGTF